MRYLILSFAVVAIDAITKVLAVTHIRDNQVIELFEYLNLRLAYNYGAAFSFLDDQGGWQRWFFVIVSAGISLVLIVLLLRKKFPGPWTAVAYALLLAGAIGNNLIDRLRLGYVIDMIDFHVGNWHWPTFNVADIAISVAVAMLLAEAFGLVGRQREAGS